ncbi:MAG: pitrilysin family protein [Thermoanaerobaculia bacterium]
MTDWHKTVEESLRFLDRMHQVELDNGLTACVVEDRRTSLVTTALCYRVGTRDEAPSQGGIAHFLEHMMFKGSPLFGPGEVDQRTQALGGTNNAFTSHDCTLYEFSFASDRWVEALAIEADRMAGLALDETEIDAERAVILEEISHEEDDPWDALEMEVRDRFYGEHPYGRRVLGQRDSLTAIGRGELEAFHRLHYRPANAVLVVAGDVGQEALEPIRRELDCASTDGSPERALIGKRPAVGRSRVERRRGDVARLLVALPAPGAGEADCAPLRLLLAILGSGRASRLHRELVEEKQLCLSVSADLVETVGEGTTLIGAELIPGVEPRLVEETILERLQEAVDGPISSADLERARQILLADWVFAHERVHQQAMTAALALALYTPEYPEQHLRQIAESNTERLRVVGERYLRAEQLGVVGWSLPESSAEVQS